MKGGGGQGDQHPLLPILSPCLPSSPIPFVCIPNKSILSSQYWNLPFSATVIYDGGSRLSRMRNLSCEFTQYSNLKTLTCGSLLFSGTVVLLVQRFTRSDISYSTLSARLDTSTTYSHRPTYKTVRSTPTEPTGQVLNSEDQQSYRKDVWNTLPQDSHGTGVNFTCNRMIGQEKESKSTGADGSGTNDDRTTRSERE